MKKKDRVEVVSMLCFFALLVSVGEMYPSLLIMYCSSLCFCILYMVSAFAVVFLQRGSLCICFHNPPPELSWNVRVWNL